MDPDAVILAVASPPGRSPRGIVRLSGPDAFDLLSPHVACPWSRGAHLARLRLDPIEIPCVVPCVILVFPGPNSYTGQDSAEIQLPGNPALLEEVG